MHIPNMNQILLVFRRQTNRILPLVYEFEYFRHRRRRECRRSFRKPSYEFVQEFFRADLEVKWVPAILDEDVEQLYSLPYQSYSSMHGGGKRLT